MAEVIYTLALDNSNDYVCSFPPVKITIVSIGCVLSELNNSNKVILYIINFIKEDM